MRANESHVGLYSVDVTLQMVGWSPSLVKLCWTILMVAELIHQASNHLKG